MATFERCVDIASYLKARPLNSAQANILVDDGLNALVSDFGMAFYEKGTGDVYHWENINPAWLAPELISAGGDRATRAIDVYSFALLCVEVSSFRTRVSSLLTPRR